MRSVSLGYFDLPKCASTSIKTVLHQQEYGFPFDERKRSTARGGLQSIHPFFARKFTGDISSAQHRIIVVRDPVERFLSGYASRVTGHMELSEAKVALRHNGGPEFEEPGFVFNPGLGQFLENLDRYLQEVSIEWHLRPLHQHLPQGLDQFTRVHQIKRIDLLQDHLSEIYGKALGLPRLQTRGEKVSIKQLSSSQLEQVFNFCQTDYELLSGWFTRDEIWNQWKSDQDAWVYNSDARRLEDALRLSRTTEDLLIGDFESKSIAYVTSYTAPERSKSDRLLDRALQKAGALLSHIALTTDDDNDEKLWKYLSIKSSNRLAQFGQHSSLLRSELAKNEPDLVHCYGLRATVLVIMSLSKLRSKAKVVVDIPASVPASWRRFGFILQTLRLLVVKLICMNSSVSPLFQISREEDKKRLQNSQGCAYFVPAVDEKVVHLATIDSSAHGVVFINAYSLLLEEVSEAAKLIVKLLDELEMSENLSYLKILMPRYATVEQALIKSGLEERLNSVRLKTVAKDSNVLAETRSSQVVIIPSLQSSDARQFTLEAQQLGRPVVAPNNSYGRFLVVHGLSGYLFSDGEIEVATRNVNRLISTRGLPEKMGFKGRIHVESYFTNEKAFEITAEKYSLLL